jgi:hypothetical protein
MTTTRQTKVVTSRSKSDTNYLLPTEDVTNESAYKKIQMSEKHTQKTYQLG